VTTHEDLRYDVSDQIAEGKAPCSAPPETLAHNGLGSRSGQPRPSCSRSCASMIRSVSPLMHRESPPWKSRFPATETAVPTGCKGPESAGFLYDRLVSETR
jgi:hypothetical protein